MNRNLLETGAVDSKRMKIRVTLSGPVLELDAKFDRPLGSAQKLAFIDSQRAISTLISPLNAAGEALVTTVASTAPMAARAASVFITRTTSP